MQAIETRVLPATNTLGKRIKAECVRGSRVIYAADELSSDQQHLAAAEALVAQFLAEDQDRYSGQPGSNPWARPRMAGQLKNGNYVHVFVSN